MPRPSFSAPARPPGAPSRRPPPLRSGSTGLCPGAEPEPRPPALRPFGMGPPRAHSETDTTLHARTHSLTRSYTHNAPAQCPLRLASSRFYCAWRYPLLPPSGERGARQVLGGPAPGPDPSLSRPPGSLFLSFLLPFPRSGRLRFLPRLSLKLRRSASSQNNKGQGGGDGRREGASEGGRGSPRGTLGSVVRDAGEGSSAPPAAVDPGAPGGLVAKEGSEASPRVTPRHLGFPGDRGTFEGSSLWIAILAQPSVSSEFVLCGRSGVGGGGEGGGYLTAWKAKQPGGRPRALESLRSRGFCPQD
ncbi:hypothetical protein R6Z07M_014908 [Ovis aries]